MSNRQKSALADIETSVQAGVPLFMAITNAAFQNQLSVEERQQIEKELNA